MLESKPVKEKFSLKIFKKKTLPRNLVLILCGVMLIIGLLLGSLLFGKQVYSPGMSSNNKKTTTVHHVADGNNNTTYAGKFIYKIPKEYDFDKMDGGVIIYGTDDAFRMTIKAVKGSYEKVANAKESIRLSFNNEKINVSSIRETSTSKNNQYVVIQATTGFNNRLYAIRAGSNDYLFYVEIVTSDNNYDLNLLDISDDIIDNVEYNDKYSNMEQVAYEDTSSMIITIADAKNNA